MIGTRAVPVAAGAIRHVLMAAPSFDEAPDFRAKIEEVVPNLRIVNAGAVPDELIDIVICDDLCAFDPSGVTNASAFLSLSLGVDRLLAFGIRPHVQIARLLTPEHQWLMREYVADHLLGAQRRSEIAKGQHAERRWECMPPQAPMAGRKAVVMGMGFLGEPTALLLRNFGLIVTGWSRTARPVPGIRCISGSAALSEAVRDADYLISLLPLTNATRRLIGPTLLRSLSSRAMLINASRAGCLDERALASMLREGLLASAVLDVIDEEPLPADSPLWDVPNLLITPHSAAVPRSKAYIPAIVDALGRLIDGRAPAHLVDRARGY
ncbi:MAG: hypothetical protein IPK66_17475 [Rhodospirillales bacterium]|nr:hypothetical protein [Rhodospirillales bacterium]